MHAIDVGPDLNFLGIQHRTDNRGCVVAAATFQIVNIAESIAAYISLSDINIGIRVHIHQSAKASGYILHVGLAVAVRTHIIQSRQHNTAYAAFMQILVHHSRAHKLATSQNLALLGHSELTLNQSPDISDTLANQHSSAGAGRISGVKFGDNARILHFQSVQSFLSTGNIALVKIVGNLHQSIGGTRHGAQYNHIASSASY